MSRPSPNNSWMAKEVRCGVDVAVDGEIAELVTSGRGTVMPCMLCPMIAASLDISGILEKNVLKLLVFSVR